MEPESVFRLDTTGTRRQSFQYGLSQLLSLPLGSRLAQLVTNSLSIHSPAGQIIIDSSMFALSFAAACLIRFEGVPPSETVRQFSLWLPILISARLLVNWKSGVYRSMWRFVCLSDVSVIGRSIFLVTSSLLALRLSSTGRPFWPAWLGLPLGIIALEFLLSLFGCIGVRAGRRILYEQRQRLLLCSGQPVRRVLLYGAGETGIELLKELVNHPDIEIIGLVDDDPEKLGTVISGVRVLGNGDSLEAIVRQRQVDEVVVSIATVSSASLVRILSQCKRVAVTAKIIPGIRELLSRQTNSNLVRDIRFEDLLGRGTAEMREFPPEVRRAYTGKRILVTGAGGSIGSELVRQLLLLDPHSVMALDKDENSIYELEQARKVTDPKARVESVIADIRNSDQLSALLTEFKPEVVFHAAAHKHVPLMEKHPCEAVLNNVCGTRNLLDACRKHGVQQFVFISSDKAVNPANVMGATKRIGEELVQAYAGGGQMRLACVRFGNVMGSRGSVVLLFQKQIAEGGPITVTHPDIVRFFMTIPEAVQLVVCAGSLANRGETFVLDMGRPRRILDLAHQMLSRCGLDPGNDIQIAVTGLRPGEKLHEELIRPDEQICPTRFQRVSMIVSRSRANRASFFTNLETLIEASQRNDRQAVYEILSSMELGFTTKEHTHAPQAA